MVSQSFGWKPSAFSDVVIVQIATLAHSHRVKWPISVRAFSCKLISAVLSVARGAHVLGVVLSVHMRAGSDLHSILWSWFHWELVTPFFFIGLGLLDNRLDDVSLVYFDLDRLGLEEC